jgi:hypothetical protein
MKQRRKVTFSGVMIVRNGSQQKFYWWATETEPSKLSPQQLIKLAAKNGPFATEEEACEAFCEVIESGMWDAAWNKRQ